LPSGGDKSILKSPLWTTTPTGVFDGEGDAVDEGVGDADGLDGECAEGELFAGDDFDELGIFESVLFEFAIDVGEGELGAVDGDV